MVEKFDEIDVERINIREPDGTLRMTLSSRARTPDVLLGGTVADRSGTRHAGLHFFNDLGEECGGLSYGGTKRGDAGAGLFFDRFRSDQTIGMHYADDADGYGASFFVQDRPEGMFEDIEPLLHARTGEERDATYENSGPMRVVMGRDRDGTAGVFVCDSKGRPRIMVSVDSSDTPRIRFLDENGTVTFSLPPD